VLERLKGVARQRPWVPGHGGIVLRQGYDRDRNARAGYTDFDHLRAAARWLAVAQDSQSDGGVAGRYRLDRGFTSSYPETTGYLVPTFLALDKALPGEGFATRAARAVDFLLRVQLDGGGFPGMEIADNKDEPSPFNTGQILHGLTAWHRATGDERAFDAAARAAAWLVKVQDGDGAFRKHTYLGRETTYTAHLTCWLAEWGAHARDENSLAAAGRHLDRVMSQAKPNGWIARMGFDAESHEADQAFTHTIAYTIWGVLVTSLVLRRDDGIALAEKGAEALLRLSELNRRLPGVVSNWQSRSPSTCLTGNAQTALIWFRLHRRSPNLRFVNGALKLIDHVKAVQPMTGRNSGITGAIAGSDPVSGPYIPNAFPNWAAKFFIDALLEKQAVLRELARSAAPAPPEMQAIAARHAPPRPMTKLHVVFLTSAGSRRVPALLKAMGDMAWGRLTVAAERPKTQPALSRIEQGLRSDGLRWLDLRAARRNGGAGSPKGADDADLAAFCRARRIKRIETAPFDSPEGAAAIKALAPDLGILAGGPILRQELLACFRLGVVNSHMAMLPAYRGIDAAEWAALEGATPGCSVYVIDEGIGTGPLLAREAFDTFDCRTVAELLDAADAAQIKLLAEVVRGILASGALPEPATPPEPPRPQYFHMHRELAALLHRRLEAQDLS